MSIGFKIDRSKLDDRVRKIEQVMKGKLASMKQETEQKSRQAAGYACDALMHATMPSEASGIGKAIANIKSDFRQIYKTPGDVYQSIKESNPRLAAAFYAAYKKGDQARAESFLSKSSSSLKNLRFGHAVSKDGQEINTYTPAIISDQEMKQFLTLIVQRLGKTASGWAACLEKLGFSGNTVKWKGTAIHGSDGGDVNIINEKDKVTYRIVNLRPLARKLINPMNLASITQEAREYLIRLLKQP